MLVPLDIRRVRLALALASVVAASSAGIGAGAFPALAQTGDETTVVTETEFVPTETVATEEAPPVVVRRRSS